MTHLHGGFTPVNDDAPVLVERELFEQMVEAMAKAEGKEFTLEYTTLRGTITYANATVYETEPHPDPLTVGE
jgi:hypothetical protein